MQITAISEETLDKAKSLAEAQEFTYQSLDAAESSVPNKSDFLEVECYNFLTGQHSPLILHKRPQNTLSRGSKYLSA